jgi:drug/metabolite transporter (DMT)-like permease
LALIGAVGATGYLLIGRRLRPHLPLMPYIAVVYTVTALVLLFLAAATRSPLSGYTGQTYLMLVLLALVPQVMGHSLLNWALARVSATIVAVSIRAEPVIATILALLILGEIPRLTSIIGGIVIIAGVYLAVVSPAVPERAGRR